MDTTALTRSPFMAPVIEPRAPESVRTALPAPKAVTQLERTAVWTDPGARRRADLERQLTAQSETEKSSETADLTRGYVADEASRALVFRVTDASSGAVVYQIPTEQAMKLRAYAEQADKARSAPAGEADLEA